MNVYVLTMFDAIGNSAVISFRYNDYILYEIHTLKIKEEK